MTLSPAVEEVVRILAEIGYVSHNQPVRIGSVAFDFAAILTTDRSLDLVVVVDTLQEDPKRFPGQLSSLGRALDVVNSRRSMSIVLIGPTPAGSILEEIGRSGRVLLVGVPLGDVAAQAIQEALAVLLPLELPRVADYTQQSWSDLRAALTDAHPRAFVEPILDAADQGAPQVREVFRAMVAQPFAEDGDV